MPSESNKEQCREPPGSQASGFFERLKSVLLVGVGNLGPLGREAACTGRGSEKPHTGRGGWQSGGRQHGPLSTTPAPNKQESRECTCVPQHLHSNWKGAELAKEGESLPPSFFP